MNQPTSAVVPRNRTIEPSCVGTSTAIATVVLYRLISFGFIIGAGWITWLAIQRRQGNRPAVTAAA
jgi:hypothetical protein